MVMRAHEIFIRALEGSIGEFVGTYDFGSGHGQGPAALVTPDMCSA